MMIKNKIDMNMKGILMGAVMAAVLCSCDSQASQQNAVTGDSTQVNTFMSNNGGEDASAAEGSDQSESTDADFVADNDAEEISGKKRLRMVSYNVENLFDTVDDPKTDDDDFTPGGKYQWNKKKYQTKLDNVAKALISAGGNQAPAIIALCEIENKTVLRDLIQRKKMRGFNYRYVHKDSPDGRGIDVALLYRSDVVTVSNERWITVELPNDLHTRDLLYAKCTLMNKEVLHVIVNHWPSMREGEAQTAYKRVAAAKCAKEIADSVLKKETNAKIVMVGDFNTNSDSECLTESLGVKSLTDDDKVKGNGLYNLMARLDGNRDMGTHKYNGKWSVLDQVIVSGNLLNKHNDLFVTKTSAKICQSAFLMYQSKGHYYPKRTFKGTNFNNGYSDHLPVTVDLYLNK